VQRLIEKCLQARDLLGERGDRPVLLLDNRGCVAQRRAPISIESEVPR
jgi:hypothetical protein